MLSLYILLSNQQRASVGEKMFEVSGHSGTLKKIKKRFNEAINLHMDYPTAISGKLLVLRKIENQYNIKDSYEISWK